MGVQGQPKKTLKEIIAEEYRKCALDPIYFMKKYCVIQHPVRGKIPFHLFPFQEDCLTDFKENRLNIILKSRQLGLSTLGQRLLRTRTSLETSYSIASGHRTGLQQQYITPLHR